MDTVTFRHVYEFDPIIPFEEAAEVLLTTLNLGNFVVPDEYQEMQIADIVALRNGRGCLDAIIASGQASAAAQEAILSALNYHTKRQTAHRRQRSRNIRRKKQDDLMQDAEEARSKAQQEQEEQPTSPTVPLTPEELTEIEAMIERVNEAELVAAAAKRTTPPPSPPPTKKTTRKPTIQATSKIKTVKQSARKVPYKPKLTMSKVKN